MSSLIVVTVAVVVVLYVAVPVWEIDKVEVVMVVGCR